MQPQVEDPSVYSGKAGGAPKQDPAGQKPITAPPLRTRPGIDDLVVTGHQYPSPTSSPSPIEAPTGMLPFVPQPVVPVVKSAAVRKTKKVNTTKASPVETNTGKTSPVKTNTAKTSPAKTYTARAGRDNTEERLVEESKASLRDAEIEMLKRMYYEEKARSRMYAEERDELKEELRVLRLEYRKTAADNRRLQAKVEAMEKAHRQEVADLRQEIADLRQEAADLRQEAADLRAQNQALLNRLQSHPAL